MGANEQADSPTISREEILEDHRHVRASLEDLEKHIGQETADEGPWRDHLKGLLSDFEERLKKHFKFEEEGGLFEQLKEEAPRLANRVDKIFADHPAILAQLQKLSGGLSTGPSGMSMSVLIEETSKLITHVREHEAEENDIMMGALWDDVGGRG
ncbi:MAG: hypothetical protein DRJ42_25235 [Deltaproteobacteria bacterium]|nr:MAG: hypothetical protein DRJ42_25235 [Deltaproteobacteria bacterium]